MRKKSTALNIEYSFVQAFFWMGFCVCSAYAAVFLQGRGYSNSELGLIISLGSIAAFIISPSLASKLDRSKESALFVSLWVIIAVQLLSLIGFLLVSGKGIAVSVMYCVYLTTTIIANPIQTQLCFLMSGWGGDVNYGAARGMGSLAYALTSMFVGARIAKLGTGVLTIAALVQYVSLTIRPEDSAKGQSLSYSMSTLGSIFAGLFGGIMYDSLSVRTTLLIGSAVCLAGAALCIAFVEKTRDCAKAE